MAVEKVADHGPVSNKKTRTYDNKAMLYGQFVKVLLCLVFNATFKNISVILWWSVLLME